MRRALCLEGEIPLEVAPPAARPAPATAPRPPRATVGTLSGTLAPAGPQPAAPVVLPPCRCGSHQVSALAARTGRLLCHLCSLVLPTERLLARYVAATVAPASTPIRCTCCGARAAVLVKPVGHRQAPWRGLCASHLSAVTA